MEQGGATGFMWTHGRPLRAEPDARTEHCASDPPAYGAAADVHLMIVEPEKYIEAFAAAGADIITVHAEACPHLHRVVHQIKEAGARAGVAINPGTSLTAIEEVLAEVDLVLIMTVNPGFGGQKFIASMTDKIRRLRQRLNELGRAETHIEVDGGITVETAPLVAAAGADVLVAGSAVYGADSREAAIQSIRESAERAWQ